VGGEGQGMALVGLVRVELLGRWGAAWCLACCWGHADVQVAAPRRPDPTPHKLHPLCWHQSANSTSTAPCPLPLAGDFPDVDRYREILSAFDLSRFPKLDKSMIRQVGAAGGGRWVCRVGQVSGQGRVVGGCGCVLPPMRTACAALAWRQDLAENLSPCLPLRRPCRLTTRYPWTSPRSCARWRTLTSERWQSTAWLGCLHELVV
jgi:hypothetical protein